MRAGKRAPQRSRTHHVYESPESSAMTLFALLQQLGPAEDKSDTSDRPAPPIPEPEQAAPKQPQPVRRRPPLGPPRRSHSATNLEPIPHHHRPSKGGMTFMDLPAELHFAVFDFLDAIDSTCLGLTNKHFYSIHRRLHGKVPLSKRREGPNELEWAWHLAGAAIPQTLAVPSWDGSSHASSAAVMEVRDGKALSRLRVRGQAYCRKCGVTRCELHKHIQEWMGEGAEYCSVKQKFGLEAPQGAKPYCFMSKPGDPGRCGRHWVRKDKVVLQ